MMQLLLRLIYLMSLSSKNTTRFHYCNQKEKDSATCKIFLFCILLFFLLFIGVDLWFFIKFMFKQAYEQKFDILFYFHIINIVLTMPINILALYNVVSKIYGLINYKRIIRYQVNICKKPFLVEPKILLAHCICNDFNEANLNQLLKQDYHNYDIAICDDSNDIETMKKIDI